MARKKKIDPEMDVNNEAVPTASEKKPAKKTSKKTSQKKETSKAAENYILKNEISLDEIQDFIDEIFQQLSAQATVTIDLSKVDTMTTALIQSIISLNRHAEDLEKKIIWQNPTPAFSDAFNNLGFYSEMMKLEFVA